MPRLPFTSSCFVRISALWTVAVACSPALGDESLSFNQDIRPILSEYCFACHGPDENHRSADLRLDQQEDAVDYGAIVPEDPEASLLVERIYSDSPDLIMPPGDAGKKLSEEQKELLVRWIRQGAVYQRHWSFEPIPDQVAVPELDASGASESSWAKNPIDHFVAKAHRQRGLGHREEADRATWLRRVTFDLTGLPPTLEELDAFQQDDSADAYEKVVNRLLESPAYGERMASMWLDVARYADTFGYQSDVEMDVWPWRQWVIEAFNRNLPYDQFLTEQIAGDMLPQATDQQRLATAFNRLHRQTNEGGSIPEEFRLTGIADRTTTAGTAFLGLTLECCRCHDHKFDPITKKEFYQLSAYFSDIDEFGLYSHFTHTAPPPAMLLYDGDQREQHQAAKADVAEAESALEAATRNARQRWEGSANSLNLDLPTPRPPVFSMALEGEVPGVVGKATACDGDQEIVCEGAPQFGRVTPFSYSLWVRPAVKQARMIVLHQSRAAEDSGFRGLQLTLDDGHPEFSMIHFWPGNAVRIRAKTEIPLARWSHLAVTHDGSGRASGLRLFVDGNEMEVEVIRDKLTRDVLHRQEWGDMEVGRIKLALGARFRDIGFRDGQLDELKVYDTQLSSSEILALYHEVRPDDGDRKVQLEMAVEHQLLTAEPDLNEARKALQSARANENEIMTGVRQIMAMQHFDQAPQTFVLNRGDYASKAEPVTASTPQFTGQLQADGTDRLALAKWMTHPANPLTARVIANRMWHLFFGKGIVVTLEDFGSQGMPPSHPELLDYLSRGLIDHGWDLHWLCRQIVLSATYRQTSTVTDATTLKLDPQNTWLTRGPKHRLSAEQLRDAVLAASGLLVKKLGGPSVKPYQPAGLWREAGTGKSYDQSTGEGLYRRSLYTFWKRTAPPPSMITFDATSRETCTARRELTTTPLQALVFLNDPQYVEASRVLAERLIENHASDLDGRWNELFRRLISRLPSPKERELFDQLYRDQLQYFQEQIDRAGEFLQVGSTPLPDQVDRADLAATTVAVQTLIAYDESIMLR